MSWVNPVAGRISSKFGNRRHPITGKTSLHGGTDIAAATGTSVKAANAGTATVTWNSLAGNKILVTHAGGIVTTYHHLSAVSVKSGQKVSAGQTIGKVGQTGSATGPHLHFEVHRSGTRVDPQPFMRGKGIELGTNGTASTSKKSVAQLAKEVIAGKHGTGDARKKALGSQYAAVQAEVNRILSGKSKPKPKKSVAAMAKEVIAGKHGTGHANRQKSLGISASEYAKVRAQVNRRAKASSKPSKTVAQMASEVIAGKHGTGHTNRRKSLGINAATYAKVRAEVNKRLK